MNKVTTFLTNKATFIMLCILAIVAICIFFPAFFPAIYNFIQTNPFFSKNLFNFLVVIVFFTWLFKKINFIGILNNKKDEIIKLIRNAETKKEQSIKKFEQTNNELKNIDNDIAKIISDAKNISKSIEEKSQEKLNNEILNLDKRAEKLKQGYENKAKIEVSQKIANASIAISKQYIENSLDEKMHKELIYNFINNLENMRVE